MCHCKLSDAEIEKDLSIPGDFLSWNGTSLHHLAIIAIGANGVKNQLLADDLILKYLKWAEQNKPNKSFFWPTD